MKYNVKTSELIDKVKITEERIIPVNVTEDGVKSKVYLDWVIVTEKMLYKTKKGNYFEYIVRTYAPVQENYKYLKRVDTVKFGCPFPEVWYETKRQLGY